jgi:uncharacterized protein
MYNSVGYEWDEAKRIASLAKHGLNFADAGLLYESCGKQTPLAKYSGENRWRDVAVVQTHGGTLTLIYMIRESKVRVVSFRPASRKERKAYETDKIRAANY